MRQQGLVLPFSRLFALTWAGQFFNSILPGSTGGDVVKVYQLCRLAAHSKAAAAASVFSDRLVALCALVVMSAIAVVCDPAPLRVTLPQHWPVRNVLLSLAALSVLASLVAWLIWRTLPLLRIGGRIQRTLVAVGRSMRPSAGSASALLLSFGLHVLNFSIVYCFCRALELSIGYAQVLAMMPVLFTIVLLPITINGHGLRELLLIAYFSHYGVRASSDASAHVQDLAVALSLLAVSNDLVWSLPGGIYYSLFWRNVEKGSSGR